MIDITLAAEALRTMRNDTSHDDPIFPITHDEEPWLTLYVSRAAESYLDAVRLWEELATMPEARRSGRR
jgi:hypothetical protein